MFTETVTMPEWFFFALLLALMVFALRCMYLEVKAGNFRVLPRRGPKREGQSQCTLKETPCTNSLVSPETPPHAAVPTTTSRPGTIPPE